MLFFARCRSSGRRQCPNFRSRHYDVLGTGGALDLNSYTAFIDRQLLVAMLALEDNFHTPDYAQRMKVMKLLPEEIYSPSTRSMRAPSFFNLPSRFSYPRST
jgi:hypothetical protein